MFGSERHQHQAMGILGSIRNQKGLFLIWNLDMDDGFVKELSVSDYLFGPRKGVSSWIFVCHCRHNAVLKLSPFYDTRLPGSLTCFRPHFGDLAFREVFTARCSAKPRPVIIAKAAICHSTWQEISALLLSQLSLLSSDLLLKHFLVLGDFCPCLCLLICQLFLNLHASSNRERFEIFLCFRRDPLPTLWCQSPPLRQKLPSLFLSLIAIEHCCMLLIWVACVDPLELSL